MNHPDHYLARDSSSTFIGTVDGLDIYRFSSGGYVGAEGSNCVNWILWNGVNDIDAKHYPEALAFCLAHQALSS